MSESLRGVYHILSTPFLPDTSLDESSLRRLVEQIIRMSVSGITILGVAGEAHKLRHEERQRVIAIVTQVTAGRVPIIVGVSQEGTDTTIAACQEAEQAGAIAVMVAPPTFLQPGAALSEHFRRVGAEISIPIVLQDYPPVNGVQLSPSAIANLVEAVPTITTIKLEDPPTPLRIAQTLALVGERVTVLGGLGGMYLLDELRQGASGTMTGFAFPEVLLGIWNAWDRGERVGANQLYYRYLPLLVFEGQPKLGLAVRKELLRRRQLIDHAVVRHPGPTLDSGTVSALDETLTWLGIEDLLEPLELVLNASR